MKIVFLLSALVCLATAAGTCGDVNGDGNNVTVICPSGTFRTASALADYSCGGGVGDTECQRFCCRERCAVNGSTTCSNTAVHNMELPTDTNFNSCLKEGTPSPSCNELLDEAACGDYNNCRWDDTIAFNRAEGLCVSSTDGLPLPNCTVDSWVTSQSCCGGSVDNVVYVGTEFNDPLADSSVPYRVCIFLCNDDPSCEFWVLKYDILRAFGSSPGYYCSLQKNLTRIDYADLSQGIGPSQGIGTDGTPYIPNFKQPKSSGFRQTCANFDCSSHGPTTQTKESALGWRAEDCCEASAAVGTAVHALVPVLVAGVSLLA